MDKTYEDGMRDGKIEAVESIQAHQGRRLDNHEHRLSSLEKVMYGVMAIVVFIEFWPQFQSFLS